MIPYAVEQCMDGLPEGKTFNTLMDAKYWIPVSVNAQQWKRAGSTPELPT